MKAPSQFLDSRYVEFCILGFHRLKMLMLILDLKSSCGPWFEISKSFYLRSRGLFGLDLA